MKTYTFEDIRELKRFSDPSEKISEDWTGTALDVLKLPNVTPEDKIWVVTRWLTDKQNRLFAVWCAREALKLTDKPDPRSVAACDVAEKFALGEATKEELAAAGAAAAAATYWAAARAAYWAARAAGAAARDAAADAAGAAAAATYWAAAAAGAAAGAAAAARAAAAAARAAQIKRLIEALENNEWD